ncbi:MAG: hypothetical protein NVS9B13_22480 [Candidatus Acidiferrum sp.]
MKKMTTQTRWWIAGLAGCVAIAAGFWYGSRCNPNGASREELLAYLPAEANAVVYADVQELRATGFLKDLFSWAPREQVDAEYAEFLGATGFDYERDLDRVAIAMEKHDPDTTVFAVAEGRFDQAKITSYATKLGHTEKVAGREIFSVLTNGGSHQIKFTFLSKHRIALTNGVDLTAKLAPAKPNPDSAEWQTRFERLAGSPVFGVVRQDAGTAEALAQQAPGGWRSPQFSALLNQLQWVTIAAKPDINGLRVVNEGECASEKISRQLSDLLTGVILLAQDGLNDAKTREKMDPEARAAYLELLKSADVTRIDRRTAKSVRLVFIVTPRLLGLTRVRAPEQSSVPKTSMNHP